MSANSRRFSGTLILVVAGSFIALAPTGHIMVYDGFWFLFSSLSAGRPPPQHGRISYVPFYWLHLLAAKHGGDVPTCALPFGLCFDVFTAAVLCCGFKIDITSENPPIVLQGDPLCPAVAIKSLTLTEISIR
jgi:hypothetical protein